MAEARSTKPGAARAATLSTALDGAGAGPGRSIDEIRAAALEA